MLCACELTAPDHRVEVNLREQVALRVTAANLHHAWQGLAEFIHGTRMVAARVRQQAAAGGQADALPDGMLLVLHVARVGLHAAHQRVGFGPASARQAVEVLHVEEGQGVVVQPLRQKAGDILPAALHINARQLQPRE